MAKYNEIMDHVKVTPEMKKRVLKNVDAHIVQKNRAEKKSAEKEGTTKLNNNLYRILFPVIGTAAAAVLLFGVLVPWNNSRDLNFGRQDHSQVAGAFDETEYSSAKELSKGVGFDIKEIGHLPFDVTDTKYLSISGNLAELIYYSGEDRIIYRKSEGGEDNSGDYNSYPTVKELESSDLTITASGDEHGYYLAVWSDGQYSYSLSFDKAVTEEELLRMLE